MNFYVEAAPIDQLPVCCLMNWTASKMTNLLAGAQVLVVHNLLFGMIAMSLALRRKKERGRKNYTLYSWSGSLQEQKLQMMMVMIGTFYTFVFRGVLHVLAVVACFAFVVAAVAADVDCIITIFIIFIIISIIIMIISISVLNIIINIVY